MNPVIGTGRTSVDIGGDASVEVVDKFFHLPGPFTWCGHTRIRDSSI